MAQVLAFWATSLLVGILALPIAFALLRRLPDAGSAFAMPLGLVLAGWGYFILRVASVLPFGRGGYILALALLALFSCTTIGRDRHFLSTFRRAAPSLVAVFGIFTCAFFVYAAFRSYNAEITGTEQPMDFMYLNSTLTSRDYPPKDAWLAGEKASYYYFGYLQAGLLTSVSGVTPATGYNLTLAYTFAAAATAIASLAYALARWTLGSRARNWALGAAALAVGMLLFLGSLSAVFELAAAHGDYNRGLYGKMGVEWLIPCTPGGDTKDCYTGPTNPRTTEWYPTEFWFWWRGTRIIPDTINEFPFFSFLLGDLHPHVMSIPLVLLVLGISASIWRGRRPLSWRVLRRKPALAALLGVLIGALAFQNAWDILTFTAVLFVAVLARNLRRLPLIRAPGDSARFPALLATFGFILPILVLAVVFYVPWYVDFSSQASGFEPYAGAGTRPSHAFLQFGPLLLAGVLIAVVALRRAQFDHLLDAALATLWLPLLPFLAWIALAAAKGELSTAIDARTNSGWVTLFLYAGATWLMAISAVVLWRKRSAAATVAALCALGALLIFGAELFYIRDIFNNVSPRLNTVFKLTYQAWILLSLGASVAFVAALRSAVQHRTMAGWLTLPVALVFLAGLVYPVTAAMNRTEGFTRDTAIDGNDFVRRADPAEYAIEQWIRNHTNPADTILEATGRKWGVNQQNQLTVVDASVDYTDAARISQRTGRSTLIGWYFHEIQWRGDTPSMRANLEARQAIADAAYTSKEPAVVLEAMRSAGAHYLVVGRLEQSRYPVDHMAAFDQFLDLVFQSGDLEVYRLPSFETVATS